MEDIHIHTWSSSKRSSRAGFDWKKVLFLSGEGMSSSASYTGELLRNCSGRLQRLRRVDLLTGVTTLQGEEPRLSGAPKDCLFLKTRGLIILTLIQIFCFCFMILFNDDFIDNNNVVTHS